jgi:two-component system, OmpR family, response regulator
MLLEDDKEIRHFVARGLEELGHHVHAFEDGLTALDDIGREAFDLLILDRMVPGLDGLSVLSRARGSGCKTPVLLLTAKSGIEDRVEGLEAGADDYLVKPFAFIELAARVDALGRRPPLAEGSTTLHVGDIVLDLLRRQVQRGGRIVDLQPREFALLEQLMRNPERVVTRTMLLDRVWGLGFDPKTNIVESHMSRLRGKLNDGFEVDAIRTIRGVGYVMRPHVH